LALFVNVFYDVFFVFLFKKKMFLHDIKVKTIFVFLEILCVDIFVLRKENKKINKQCI
jgi:hypothetical protein